MAYANKNHRNHHTPSECPVCRPATPPKLKKGEKPKPVLRGDHAAVRLESRRAQFDDRKHAEHRAAFHRPGSYNK